MAQRFCPGGEAGHKKGALKFSPKEMTVYLEQSMDNFKPENTLGNSRDFGEKDSITLIQKPKTSIRKEN